MTEKRYGKKVDDVDDTIINITEDGNDFAWFLSDDYTDEQVDKIVQRLNKLTVENEQLKLQYSELEITLMNNQLAYNDLKEENEYYKSKCASLEEGYLKLQKENEQLKQRIKEVQS